MNYDDIIDHPHFVSDKRPHMSMLERAAQFSPFAALTGYDDAVTETARLTDERIFLDEYVIEELDEKLQMIYSGAAEGRVITFIYFVQDERKAGGAYVKVSGQVKKIDTYEKIIVMDDDTVIPIGDIVAIEGI